MDATNSRDLFLFYHLAMNHLWAPVLCVPLGCFHRWWSVGIFTSYFRHGTQHIGFIAQRKYTVNVCYVCY